jgi:rfaE bifunctional protein nucleotidyltransferase chain/domain
MDTRAKILPLANIQQRIAEHRARGQRVVMANGCFDILHVGHVRYMEGARREGDVLVVCVNSDSSECRLKGAGRPVLLQDARAQLVAALGCVDYVVIFEDLTVEPLLHALRPDVHAKGTDYTHDTVPEREVAAKLGIRVAIVGDPKDHSTTELLGRLREPSHG